MDCATMSSSLPPCRPLLLCQPPARIYWECSREYHGILTIGRRDLDLPGIRLRMARPLSEDLMDSSTDILFQVSSFSLMLWMARSLLTLWHRTGLAPMISSKATPSHRQE